MNGALECEYRKYEIFDGRYKEFKEEGKNLDKREGQTRRTNLRGKAPFDRKRTYDSDRRSDKTERFDRSGKPSFRRDSKQGKPIGKKHSIVRNGSNPTAKNRNACTEKRLFGNS